MRATRFQEVLGLVPVDASCRKQCGILFSESQLDELLLTVRVQLLFFTHVVLPSLQLGQLQSNLG